MRIGLATAFAVALSAAAIGGTTIRYTCDVAPDHSSLQSIFSTRVFGGGSWAATGGELTIKSVLPEGCIWFGRHPSFDTVPWQLAAPGLGNFASMRARLAGDAQFQIYIGDGTWAASWGIQPGAVEYQWGTNQHTQVTLDTTQYRTYGFTLLNGTVTYYIDGDAVFSGRAYATTANILVVGDGAGSHAWGYGTMIVDEVLVATGIADEGTLAIDVTPDAGSWTIMDCPAGYPWPKSGTGDMAARAAPVGSYTVEYGALAGHTAPANQTLSVAQSSHTAFSGIYGPQMGGLSIDVTPNGGTWTVTDCPADYAGPRSGAGDLVPTAAPVGSYTVAYGALAGYTTPAGQTRSVNEGSNTGFSGVYVRQQGTISIDLTPDAGSWRVTGHPDDYAGPTSGTGDLPPTGAPGGSYTVEFGDLDGFGTPDDQTKSVVAGANTAFAGLYSEFLNLVLPANGGVLESFTSQLSRKFGRAAALTDGRIENGQDCWCSAPKPGVQEFVFSFKDGEAARLDRVAIYNFSLFWQIFDALPSLLKSSLYSRDVEIDVSADGTNFVAVTNVTLEASLEAQDIDIGDVVAKKIKLVVTSGYGTKLWQMAEFEVYGCPDE